jgi:hypothetical protein
VIEPREIIEMRKGRDGIDRAKATLEYHLDIQPFRGPRAWHADIVNARNLGDPFGVNRMLNYDTKKDNFKTSIILQKEVRLLHSSGEGR